MISRESGDLFNESFGKNNDQVFFVLWRLHARSCQITMEILALLKSGFADGAHARWRTLHEIAVTALFIKQQGIWVDCALAAQ